MKRLISAVFPFKDKLIAAIRRIKESGINEMEVKMPVPDHDILDVIDHKPTWVGLFTLFGGIAGMTTGFVGPAWAHAHWSNIIGGKPVISLPPFIVIMFELMILFGATATLVGVLLLCRLPNTRLLHDRHFDERATEDHYILHIRVPEEKLQTVQSILDEEGAEVRL